MFKEIQIHLSEKYKYNCQSSTKFKHWKSNLKSVNHGLLEVAQWPAWSLNHKYKYNFQINAKTKLKYQEEKFKVIQSLCQ